MNKPILFLKSKLKGPLSVTEIANGSLKEDEFSRLQGRLKELANATKSRQVLTCGMNEAAKD